MKRVISLTMALLLVLALFSGCGGKKETTPNSAAETPPDADQVHYAAGKYEKDAEGWPTDYYSYETPICTKPDTVLTYWTSCYMPEYIPADGMESVDFHREEARLTGVDVEYILPAWTERASNYAVLRASDDLPDMMAQVGLFITGSKQSAIADGTFVNLYDWREYCPNYMYSVASHMDEEFDVYTSVFLDEKTIFEFKAMYNVALPSAALMGVRRDWIEDVGLSVEDIVTVEDFHQLLLLFQSQKGCEHPLWMNNAVDGGNWFACYDTYTYLDNVNASMYPNPCVVDGQVQFCYSNDNAKAFVEMMRQWVADRLVSPDWIGDSVGVYFEDCYDGKVATTALVPQTIPMLNEGTREQDPDADWWYISRSVLYEGQVLHLGNSASYANSYNAGTSISSSCENIPLAVTWCDWRYSPEGSFLGSYGVEGTMWNYDEQGEPVASDWAYNNPDNMGWAWLTLIYAMNFQSEHGLKHVESQYNNYSGAVEEALSVYADFQSYAYDGAYEWPKGVTLTEDQSNDFMEYGADLSTYVQENIILFINGDKPMSEWDAYISGLDNIGIQQARAVYQEAYDAYAAKYGIA